MYVYFDENGILKEIISDKSFRVGDSKRDKIYVYWDGEHSPISGWVKYRKPDGTEYPISVEECFFQLGDQLVRKTLPNKPLRNLKYFSYDHTYEVNGETHIGYQFYEIIIPDAILNSSIDNEEVPTENNMVIARIRFVMDDGSVSGEIDKADSIEALGALVFSVETNIGILTDSSINETQYNYLIALLSAKLGLNTKSVKLASLPETGEANTIYYILHNGGGIIRDVYFWNGQQFVFLGTTSYDLYTKEDGEDFEIAIQALWNSEMTDYKAFMNSSWANYQNTINAQIANLSQYIQSAASGSPKGVYATLSALQTAYPSGTNGIYVVSDNGHWYYWNGSAWTDGGIYQATELSTQDREKIDMVPQLKGDLDNLNNKFLFSNGEWVDGYYVNYDTGGTYEQSGYSRTNHISIPKGISKIKVYSKCEIEDYSGIAFYKSNVFISGVKITGTNPVSMTISEVNIPNGAETFRYSCYTNAKNNAYVSIDSNIASIVSNIDNQIDSVNNKFDFMLIDTIDKPMVFANKNIIGFGDSIMAGYNELGVIVENNWVNLFKEKSGATNFTNRAIGGAGFAVTENTIASQLTGQILDTRDYIFVGAGTNDYHYSISKEDFISGITSAFDIIDANKGSQTKVIVITPINRTKDALNNNPISINWYRETITMYALRRGYSVIDGSKMGFTSVAGKYQEATMVDGLHPNELGYEIYARHLYGMLL